MRAVCLMELPLLLLSEDPLENRICSGCYGDLKENLKHVTFYLLLMLHSVAFISEDKSN